MIPQLESLEGRDLPSALLTIITPPIFPAGADRPVPVAAQIADDNGGPVHVPGVPVLLTSSRGDLGGQALAWTDADGLARFAPVVLHLSGLHTFTVQSAGWGAATSDVFSVEPVATALGVNALAATLGQTTPEQTLTAAHYGPGLRQVLDFWRAPASWIAPAPLVVYVHGGGLFAGDRGQVAPVVAEYLRAGFSVASIDYSLLSLAGTADPGAPAIAACADDVAAAIAWLRDHAEALGIDCGRIGLSGGSAGALLALGYAYTHDGIAAVGVNTAQTTLDPVLAASWESGWHYYQWSLGYPNTEAGWEAFVADRDANLEALEAFSPYSLASATSPPTYLRYFAQATPDPTHCVILGERLRDRLDALGVPCWLQGPAAVTAWPTESAFLIDLLTS